MNLGVSVHCRDDARQHLLGYLEEEACGTIWWPVRAASWSPDPLVQGNPEWGWKPNLASRQCQLLSRVPASAQSSSGQPLNSVCSNCALAPDVNESSLEPGLNYQVAPAPEAAHIWPGPHHGTGLGVSLWLTAGPFFAGVIFRAACTRAGMSELGGNFHLCFLGNINPDVLSCSVPTISHGWDRPTLPITRSPRWVPGQGPAPVLALVLQGVQIKIQLSSRCSLRSGTLC